MYVEQKQEDNNNNYWIIIIVVAVLGYLFITNNKAKEDAMLQAVMQNQTTMSQIVQTSLQDQEKAKLKKEIAELKSQLAPTEEQKKPKSLVWD